MLTIGTHEIDLKFQALGFLGDSRFPIETIIQQCGKQFSEIPKKYVFELICLTWHCTSCDVTSPHAHIAMLMLKLFVVQP